MLKRELRNINSLNVNRLSLQYSLESTHISVALRMGLRVKL